MFQNSKTAATPEIAVAPDGRAASCSRRPTPAANALVSFPTSSLTAPTTEATRTLSCGGSEQKSSVGSSTRARKSKKRPSQPLSEAGRQRRLYSLYWVYALIDPRDGSVAYIGETRDLAARTRSHQKCTKISVEDAVAVELETTGLALARAVTKATKAKLQGRITAYENLLALTREERCVVSEAGASKLPASVKVWLACLGEAGQMPVVVRLSTARGKKNAQLCETVWITRFTRAGARLHNKNLDQHGLVRKFGKADLLADGHAKRLLDVSEIDPRR